MAGASNLAARNNPHAEIHLFCNIDEACTPIANHDTYLSYAIAAESFPGEFDNITNHRGQPSLYEDFNRDGLNQANERQYWPHRVPDADVQHAGEAWYLDRLLGGLIPPPEINAEDEFVVAGFVRTKAFEVWAGDGQNAVALLAYSLSPQAKRFTFTILSNDTAAGGFVRVCTEDMASEAINVLLNGQLIDQIAGGTDYLYNSLQHADTLELILSLPVPPLLVIKETGTHWVITCASEVGLSYQLRYSPNRLGDPGSWEVIGLSVAGDGSELVFHVEKTITDNRRGFFVIEVSR